VHLVSNVVGHRPEKCALVIAAAVAYCELTNQLTVALTMVTVVVVALIMKSAQCACVCVCVRGGKCDLISRSPMLADTFQRFLLVTFSLLRPFTHRRLH